MKLDGHIDYKDNFDSHIGYYKLKDRHFIKSSL